MMNLFKLVLEIWTSFSIVNNLMVYLDYETFKEFN